MSETDEQKLFHVIPPQELRCVWMTAGILSYQLCERKFECEECPLDVALRQRFAHHDFDVSGRRIASPAKRQEEPKGIVLFGRKHLWLTQKENKKIRLGIEPGLSSVLITPKAVVLPAIGEQVEIGKACSWIVLDGGTLPMLSPITGQVTATNHALAENPHTVCVSPLDEGWLFELSSTSAELGGADVLPTSDVARVYAEDERRLRALISAEMKSGESDSLKEADYGQIIKRIADRLGPVEYLNLLRSIYA